MEAGEILVVPNIRLAGGRIRVRRPSLPETARTCQVRAWPGRAHARRNRRDVISATVIASQTVAIVQFPGTGGNSGEPAL
jgi:hypothetical protein